MADFREHRGELTELDRLADIAVGAARVCAANVVAFIRRGENDHRDQLGELVLAQALQHFVAAQPRQLEVQQYHCRLHCNVAPREGTGPEHVIERLDPVACDDDALAPAAFAKGADRQFQVIRIVFHQQYRLGSHCHCSCVGL